MPTLPTPPKQASNSKLPARPSSALRRGAIGLGSAVAVLLSAGALYQTIAARRDQTRYPAPGIFVDAGGFRLHLLVKPAPATGESSLPPAAQTPTVIIDAGLGIPSTYYTRLQDEIASFARVVIYDRAGLGYSEDRPRGMPHDALSNARALHLALANAGIPPPYVVAGHSAGGMNMLVFADTYPDDVAGVVLIDSQHPDQLQRYGPAHKNDAYKTQLMLRGMRLASRIGVTRVVNAVKMLDAGELAPHARQVLQAQFAQPRFWQGGDNEIAAWEQYTFPQARAVKSLGNKPLIVLTAEGTLKSVPEQWAMHAEYAQLSTNGSHRLIAGATHGNIVIHTAKEVAAVIREVLDAVGRG